MKRTFALTVVLAATLAVAACGSGDAGGDASPSPSTSAATTALAGTAWTLATYAGTGGAATPVPAGVEASIEFANTTASGSSGCNAFSGPYTSTDTSLTIGPLASTLRGCDGIAGLIEAAYLKLLDQVSGYAIAGDTLTMTGAKGAVLLTFTKATPVALVGTKWTATSINNGKDAVQSTTPGTTVTAVFDKDGTISGDGGCNTYSGPYTLSGNNLTFGALASTKKACEEAVSTQESAYLAALARVSTYVIRGDVLELRDSKGALQAQYKG